MEEQNESQIRTELLKSGGHFFQMMVGDAVTPGVMLEDILNEPWCYRGLIELTHCLLSKRGHHFSSQDGKPE